MQPATRQRTFRAFIAFAFLWGCITFAAGVNWLRTAMEWSRNDRDVEWQQYSMSVLLLSFAALVLLGYWRPRLASRLFLLVCGLALLQAFCLTQSTGDGVGAAVVGCIGLVGVPAALVAWLFFWRSRWESAGLTRKVTSD